MSEYINGLYLGIEVGLIPFVILFLMKFAYIRDDLLSFLYRDNACRVTLIKQNKRIQRGVGKFTGTKQISFGKKLRPVDTNEIGIEGKKSSVVLYENGNQVSINEDAVNLPISADIYNSALLQAMISASDSFIVKQIKSMRTLLIIIAILAAGSAFFGWNLVENLL